MHDRFETDALLLALRAPRRVRPLSLRQRPLHRRLRAEDRSGAEIAEFHRRLMLRFTAALDSSSLEPGTQGVWNSAGGSGFGGTITCTSLAVTTGSSTTGVRQGTKSTSLLGAPASPFTLTNNVMPELLTCSLHVQMTSAPTAGDHVDLYLAFSDSATAATDNPGGVSGTDAAGPNFTALGQLTLVGSIALSADIGTGVQQIWGVPCRPLDQYFSPVIVNSASVTFDSTAAHTSLVVTPWYRVRQS